MAHNLHTDAKSGEVAFLNANTKEKAWHKLGQQLEGRAATAKEALELAHLNFEVEKAPLEMTVERTEIDKEGQPQIITDRFAVPDKFATYRTDTNVPFGVVGKAYRPVQNREMFSFFDGIVGTGEAIYETAGALGNGSVVFISAKLPDYIKVGKDAIEKYVMLLGYHDGGGSIKAMFTPIRPVCNNTVSLALQNAKNVINIRHTSNAHQSLKQAHKIMGMQNQLTNELQQAFNQMRKVKISDADRALFIETLFPNTAEPKPGEKIAVVSPRLQNIREAVLEYSHTGPGQDMYEGTLYQAYNAVTGYFQNVREWRDEELKMNSILLGGSGGETAAWALNLALSKLN